MTAPTRPQAADVQLDESPRDFVRVEHRELLDQLLAALPAARQAFDEGDVALAVRLLNETNTVSIREGLTDHGHPVTKRSFLRTILLGMPRKFGGCGA